MEAIIDHAPPPPLRPRQVVEALEVGQSALFGADKLRALQVAASRTKKKYPNRVYQVALSYGGSRVWRRDDQPQSDRPQTDLGA